MPMTLSGTTGIVQPTAAAPAFSAYQSSAQTLSTATVTKIQLQTEEFDTNNNFDNASNYRFTPTVAGYYQINAQITVSVSASLIITYIYKNGSSYKQANSSTSSLSSNSISTVVYLNGSTDYIELYGYLGAGQALNANVFATWLNGAMVRSA